MPANVAAASPTTVLPAFIARTFRMSDDWPGEANIYANGEYQSRARTTTPTLAFEQEANAAAAVSDALWAFLEARKFIEPFYMYYGPETSPPWSHDPTGAASAGRYVVVAIGPLAIARGMARALMPIVLEQRA